MAKIALKAVNLHKTFYRPVKVPILQGLNLEVYEGEAVAIIGRSGQGKSTLLQCLGTLENPCKGTLEISGTAVTKFNKTKIRNRNLSFIFQSFHLLEDYTALENVLMPCRIAREDTKSGSDAYKRACHLLGKVGLYDRMHFHTKFLSGGEKQRVALARALSNNPDIILADEPSGNLDAETASYIHKILMEFASNGKSVIIVTHDKHLASLCHKQYTLQDGILNAKI